MKTNTLYNRDNIAHSIMRQIRRIGNKRPAGTRGMVFLPAVWGRTWMYNPANTRPVIRLTPRPGDLIIAIPSASDGTPDEQAIRYSLTHPRYVRTVGVLDGDQAVSVCQRTVWQAMHAPAIVDDRGGVWITTDTHRGILPVLRHVLPASGRVHADFDTIAGDRSVPAIAPRWLDCWDGTPTGGCIYAHSTRYQRTVDDAACVVWRAASNAGVRVTQAAVRKFFNQHLRGAMPVPGVRLDACGHHARAVRAQIVPEQISVVRDMLAGRDGIAWIRAAIAKH